MRYITRYSQFEDTLRDEISPEGDTRICIVWDVQSDIAHLVQSLEIAISNLKYN